MSFVSIAALLSMLRLAATTNQFASWEHWEEKYKNGRSYGKSYEWYDLSWEADIRPRLGDLVPPPGSHKLDALVSGCGNSPNSAAMFEDGFARRLVSVDRAPAAIELMKEQHPDMEWQVADSMTLDGFDDGSFDMVFDKGLLDAIRGSKEPELTKRVFEAYSRVLRRGGFVVLVSSCMEAECVGPLEEVFHRVVVEKIPKANLEMLKKQAAKFKMEVREFDMLYIAYAPPVEGPQPDIALAGEELADVEVDREALKAELDAREAKLRSRRPPGMPDSAEL